MLAEIFDAIEADPLLTLQSQIEDALLVMLYPRVAQANGALTPAIKDSSRLRLEQAIAALDRMGCDGDEPRPTAGDRPPTEAPSFQSVEPSPVEFESANGFVDDNF